MKKFRIGVFEEHSGYMEIEAKTKKEAEEKALGEVVEKGIDAIEDFDITHREVYLV